MKTLHNYIVTPFLRVGETGPEVMVGDQVKLFLDTTANPGFPTFILGVVQHPIASVNCGSSKSYSISYDEADLDGAAAFIHADDVIDIVVVSQAEVVSDALDAEIAARIAADALKAPLTSPALTGNPTAPTPAIGDNDTSIATTAFVGLNSNRFLNATQGIYQKIVISGAAGSEIITIQNY